MQLAALVAEEVDAAHPRTELEAQRRVVAQGPGDPDEVFAGDVEGELAAVDDGLLDGVGGKQVLLLQGPFELVSDFVEPAAVRAGGGARQGHGADEAAVAGGVTAVVGAEHALAYADDLAGVRARGGHTVVVALFVVVVVPAHRSSPFISIRGSALSAASSASRAASSALTPSLEPWIFWWSLRIASISISGRGGQPGK